MKINKSLPNIRKYYLTYDKEKKVNINNIYIPHKPYNSGLKIKKNIINIDNKDKRKLKKIMIIKKIDLLMRYKSMIIKTEIY